MTRACAPGAKIARHCYIPTKRLFGGGCSGRDRRFGRLFLALANLSHFRRESARRDGAGAHQKGKTDRFSGPPCMEGTTRFETVIQDKILFFLDILRSDRMIILLRGHRRSRSKPCPRPYRLGPPAAACRSIPGP